MTALRVYVAAPFADAHVVRDVHERLLSLGMLPTSTWATTANGEEDFSAYTPERLRDFALANDADVRRSHALLVMARAGAGGEMFSEIRIALEWGKPVFWVGRRTLSAYRNGVVLCDDVDEALGALAERRTLLVERGSRP